MPSLNSQSGVVLLESLIGILIFSMGILALAGLQATMLKNTTDAKYRSDASYLIQQQLGFMWANPNSLADYEETDKDISTQIPNGLRTITVKSGGVVNVTITWQQPGQATVHNFKASARITGAN